VELVFSATLVLSGWLLNGLALYGMAVTHDTSNELYLTTAETFKSALAKAIAHATRACQIFCVCGFVGFGSQAQGLIMQRCVGEVVLDEPGSSVGYAILYAPRHDVLNTASLGAYFRLITAF
jgi:hypothetical protein